MSDVCSLHASNERIDYEFFVWRSCYLEAHQMLKMWSKFRQKHREGLQFEQAMVKRWIWRMHMLKVLSGRCEPMSWEWNMYFRSQAWISLMQALLLGGLLFGSTNWGILLARSLYDSGFEVCHCKHRHMGPCQITLTDILGIHTNGGLQINQAAIRQYVKHRLLGHLGLESSLFWVSLRQICLKQL